MASLGEWDLDLRRIKMQIEAIEIGNYRLFRQAKLTDFPRLSVMIGPNGSGKSTLFDVFTFLKDALAQNVVRAVNRRGGFKELVSRGEQGPISITIKFREKDGPLVTYTLKISSDKDHRPYIARELLKYRRGRHGKPWHFVDFKKGKGTAITNETAYGQQGAEEDRKPYDLDDPSVLAIKGLGQFKEFRIVAEFRSLIESWHISDFHIADARPSTEFGYSDHLSTNGDNVAQVAQYLFENKRSIFDRILGQMKKRVPGVSAVEPKLTEDGRLVLRFTDGSFQDPFIARYVSDGTIKMFAYLVLLYDSQPYPLLAIEEPENQLYPNLMHELVDEFREYARLGGQVFVSTHSPDFLNATQLDELYLLGKQGGFTNIQRVSKNNVLKKLVEEGDKLGELWRQGLFEKSL